MGLRSFFDRIEPHFTKGGKYERLFPVYEMVESFIYTPKTVTTAAPHARSYVDMKRIMTYVVIATIPCILMALYNTGLQVNGAIAAYGASGWRAGVIGALGDHAGVKVVSSTPTVWVMVVSAMAIIVVWPCCSIRVSRLSEAMSILLSSVLSGAGPT